MNDLIKINALPSALPEWKRRTGHWKYSSSPTAECDQCGHIYPGFLRFENYCPHCGSFNAEEGDHSAVD